MRRFGPLAFLVILGMLLAACAPVTPQVVEKQVVVEKPVIQTVVVEKQVPVEKQVVQTVIVEKEKEVVKTVQVQVEKVVVATPEPGGKMTWSRGQPCEGGCGNPNLSGGGYVFYYAYYPAFLTTCDETGAACNQPGLASSWEESADHLTWTFHLRKDVKWSDGTPSTADDHVFTINMVANPDFGAQSFLPLYKDVAGYQDVQDKKAKTLTGVQKVDDYTFKIVFTVAKRRMTSEFSQYYLMPYHKMKDQTIDQWKDMKIEDRITVGPWYWTDIVYNQYYAMKANEYFYLGRPRIDEFVYREIPDWAVAIAGLKSGEIDAVDVTPLTEIGGLKTVDTLNIVPDAVARGYMFWYNMVEGKALPLKVRQAMSLSLDRQTIIDTLWEGYGWTMPCQAQPQGIPLKGVIADVNEYNPDKAKQLIAEAKSAGWNGKGWNGKDDMTVMYYYSTDFAKNLMSAVADMWKAVGLSVTPLFLPPDNVTPVFYEKKEYDILYGCCADPGTAEHYQMDTLYSCDCAYPKGWCGQGVCDKNLDALLATAASTFDRAEEIKAIQGICSYINDNMITMPLWMSPGLWTVNARLGNTIAPDGKFNKYTHTWFIQSTK